MQITIDTETYRRYQLYAAAIPRAKALPEEERVDRVIAYALRDWMESVGQGHIEDAVGLVSEFSL
jgi:hypothetical protein